MQSGIINKQISCRRGKTGAISSASEAVSIKSSGAESLRKCRHRSIQHIILHRLPCASVSLYCKGITSLADETDKFHNPATLLRLALMLDSLAHDANNTPGCPAA